MDNFTFVQKKQTDPDLLKWIISQIDQTRPFFLGFADDGLIWGKHTPEGFKTSNDADASLPELNSQTLQQAFIFGPSDQLHIYRDGVGVWVAVHVTDPKDDFIVESQILFGDEVMSNLRFDFTHVRDRSQRGLNQILPIKILPEDLKEGLAPRLRIHHFITYEENTGEARIAMSRLVTIDLGKSSGEENLS